MLTKRELFLSLLFVSTLIALFFIEPIPQDLKYHNFADKRSFFGIYNFFDVTSNLPFLFVGLSGFWYIYQQQEQNISWGWLLFFLSVTLVAAGSSYYHLNPSNETLTWDRLPMSIGFMAIFVLVLADYLHPKLEKWLLVPMCILGIISVVYWHYTDDLRLYAWVQFCSLGILAIVILMYRPDSFRTKYLVYAFIFYTLSKVTEYYDVAIYNFTVNVLSGHSIKHVLAAVGVYFFYMVLKHRRT